MEEDVDTYKYDTGILLNDGELLENDEVPEDKIDCNDGPEYNPDHH